jgi:hypothetical protein
VSVDPVQYTPDPRLKPMTLALAGIAALVAGILPAVFSILPDDVKPWTLSIIGAIGLFAAARLGFWPAVGFTGLAIGFKDVSMYLIHKYPPSPLSWPYFIAYAAIGWAFLRQTRSPLRIGTAALAGSLLFFLVSNFVCWLEPGLGYEQSLAGLRDCYVAAVPFFRGTLVGDLLFTGVLFGAHAVLSRVYFPATQPIPLQSEERW